jgi:hypothetical protein
MDMDRLSSGRDCLSEKRGRHKTVPARVDARAGIIQKAETRSSS